MARMAWGCLQPEYGGSMICSHNYVLSAAFSTDTTPGLTSFLSEVSHMPTTMELTTSLENRPGTLGRICRALADQKVTIIAFQAVPSEGNSLVRFVVDQPERAKKALDNEGLSYQETQVALASSLWQNYEKCTSGDEVCGTGKMVPSAGQSGA